MTDSKIPRFYRASVSERRRKIADQSGEDLSSLVQTLEQGGLTTEQADQIVENVIGTYRLPFGLGLNFTINGADHLVPMVVEEPSVIAAASNAAKMIRSGGGFLATMQESLLTAQIELRDVPNADRAEETIQAHKAELLVEASSVLTGLVRRGAGPRDLIVRRLDDHHLVVHLLVDCADAMGANLVNGAAEALSPRLAQLAQAREGLRILSNLADRRLVNVSARVPFSALAKGPPETGRQVAFAIEEASRFAEKDPYRAVTHNKGIMNGTDSVVIATGNDYRAVEAGAHAYAARKGHYAPLATWRTSEDGLIGRLELPLALGTVGGTLKVHAVAQLALRLAKVESAKQLAYLCASAGLASNLAALRALSTEGIQRGHMSLHARSVAAAAGANGTEVNQVAAVISARKKINQAEAAAVLSEIRSRPDPGGTKAT